MILEGRSGFGVVLSLAAAMVIWAAMQHPQDLGYAGFACAFLVLEHVGGVRHREDSLSFRNWIRWHRVPYRDITAVIVDTGVGYQMSEPVVYLQVNGRRRRLKMLPTSTSTYPDAERYAAALGTLVGVEPTVRRRWGYPDARVQDMEGDVGSPTAPSQRSRTTRDQRRPR